MLVKIDFIVFVSNLHLEKIKIIDIGKLKRGIKLLK